MFRSRAYRYDNEQVVLAITLLLVLGVIILTASVTFCLSAVFIIGLFVISGMMIRTHHKTLMQEATMVTPIRSPELANVIEECQAKLQPGEVEVYLAKKNQMNAYTFGIDSPKVLVLYTPLLKFLSPNELKFIIGHEMGHVALGHTWLNTIIGGIAGIPAPFGAAILMYAAFRWWNRMCEFSADRAGLLACGELNLAVSAMVKLVAPEVRTQKEFEQALAAIDAQDDNVSNRLAEIFQTHPMLIRRINKLRDYTRSAQYQRMQAGINGNVGGTPPRTTSVVPSAAATESIEKTEPEVPPKPPEERWPWLKPHQ